MDDSITVNPHEVWAAEVDLYGFESFVASDDMIARKFADVGFTKVTCTGAGTVRQVQGTWPWATKTIAKRDLDKHLANIRRVSP
jgi:hypothetical protein